MHTHTCTDPTRCKTRGRTLDYSPIEWTSVQAVVACNATVPRVCTVSAFHYVQAINGPISTLF